MKTKHLFAFSALALLMGCNDLKTQPEEIKTYSITAIDGYLRHANVWLDVNDNGQWDEGEPIAESGVGGVATLDVTDIDDPTKYSAMVEAIAGKTIDEDSITPTLRSGQTIQKSYVMIAPAGETVVTPISTFFHLTIKAAEANADEEFSEDAMIALFAQGFNVEPDDIFKDFIATGNQHLQFFAKKLVQTQSLPENTAFLSEILKAPEQSSHFDKLEDGFQSILLYVLENPEPDFSINDLDGDGYNDDIDVFPFNKEEWADADGDGYGDEHEDQFPNDPLEWSDSDEDGTGDNSDPSPFDRTVKNYPLALRTSAEALNLVGITYDDDQHPQVIKGEFHDHAQGDSVWIYQPIFAHQSLDKFADVSYLATSTIQNFMNIYLFAKDNNEQAVNAFRNAQSSDPRHFKELSYGGYEDDTHGHYLKITLYNGEHLNDVLEAQHLIKSDYLVASYYDAAEIHDGDYEARGNFFLRFGDSTYQGAEPFTLHSFSFEPTFVSQQGERLYSTDGQTSAEYNQDMQTYNINIQTKGDSQWVYRLLEERLTPLSSVGDFSFDYEYLDGDEINVFANIYLKASSLDVIDNIDAHAKLGGHQVFRNTQWGEGLDNTYVITLQAGQTLSDVLASHHVNVSDFNLFNFHDSGSDNDPESYGNFYVRFGDSKYEGESQVQLTRYQFDDLTI